MNSILADIKFTLRRLRKSPGFAATAILTLALGIGATTAIFTLVYQVLLRPLPVSHPEQLYKVGQVNTSGVNGGLQGDWSAFSYEAYRYLRDGTPGITGIAAVQSGTTTVSARRAGDTPTTVQPLTMHFLSGNYFEVLGVKPYAGRLLTPDDDREGAPPAAVLSYTLWQTKFGGDPRMVGSTLLLTGHPVTVIGIAAPAFLGERAMQDPPGLWLPLAQEPLFEPGFPLMKLPTYGWLNLLVRVPHAKDEPQVQLAIAGELRQWVRANAGLFPGLTEKILARQTTELVSASGGISDLRDQYRSGLKLLLLVAGFVLLIACANLANLMLVRGMARSQELAVRSTLGAPRARLIRQTLVEAVLLALFGGLAALAVAYAGTRSILALVTRGVELSPLSATPSPPVLGFALLASLGTGVVFGIAPAWITSRTSPVETLRGANRSTRDAGATPQRVLIVLQAALSLVLLSTAGLLITSLRALEHQDFHFQPKERLLISTDLTAAGYSYDRLTELYRQIDDTFAHLGGVESVAYATYTPMVVNQAFVNRFLKGKSPIGEHFGPNLSRATEFNIVGVVEDTKYTNPEKPAVPMYFTPLTQSVAYTQPGEISNENFEHFAANLVVRYRGDPGAAAATVRQALKSINPEIPILKTQLYEDRLSTNFTQQELVVRLTTLFGILALVPALIDLYGVTAYAVARRTSEIGIRMALGASRAGVLAMIVKRALTQALLGLLIGLPLCIAAGRLLGSTLYRTSGFQPLVLAVVAALLLASALLAALVPAHKAASIDPMLALRTE